MPHPLIDKTLEAKLQASRENRRCHYAKDKILSRRREFHVEKNTGLLSELEKAIARALHGYNSDEGGDEPETGNSSDIEENDPLLDLTACLLTLKVIKDEMLSLITEPCAFAEGVLLQFVNSITYTEDRANNGDKTIVTNMIATVRGLLNRSITVQDQILTFCSVSDEFRAADMVTRYLSTSLAYLEDFEFFFDVEGVLQLIFVFEWPSHNASDIFLLRMEWFYYYLRLLIMVVKWRCETDKYSKAFYVLNTRLQAEKAQQEQRKSTSTSHSVEETSNDRGLYHKHLCFTRTAPGQIATETEFFPMAESTNSHLHTSLSFDVAANDSGFLPPPCDVDQPETGNFDTVNAAYEAYLEDSTLGAKKRLRPLGDRGMSLWVEKHEQYLLELIRLEGRSDFATRDTCMGHRDCTSEPMYCCEDCLGTELYCKECTVQWHHENPLHRIKVRWNGHFFEDITLKSLRLRVQLRHPVSEQLLRLYSRRIGSEGLWPQLRTRKLRARMEEEENRKCQEEERKHQEELRMIEAAEIQREAEEKRRREIVAEMTHALSSDKDGSCTCCINKGRSCLWTDAEANALMSRPTDPDGPDVKSCDACRKDKATCPGRPGTVKVSKSKKRKHTAGSPSPKGKGKKRQKSPTPEVPDEMEYDDQAWVAAANNIVVELAQTNTLLERSIQAAEGSRAAADRMSSGIELFLQQQREFQAMLFGHIRRGFRTSPDLEEEDEVMEKASGSDAGGSGEADGSMEM
ncbi:hypothetical protein EV424DRAFT_1545274 [Suillus variegatus]|nr:hypothetical protein EV424DRAFT_1545274 [Suillus variegatus]